MPLATLTTTWAPRILSVLRVTSAMLFMEHGTLKILGFPASNRPAPELLSLSGSAGVFELFGGALLAVGLFTRPVAFLLCGVMAFAYFIAHAPRSFFPVLNGGDPVLLRFSVLCLCRRWSLEHRRPAQVLRAFALAG